MARTPTHGEVRGARDHATSSSARTVSRRRIHAGGAGRMRLHQFQRVPARRQFAGFAALREPFDRVQCCVLVSSCSARNADDSSISCISALVRVTSPRHCVSASRRSDVSTSLTLRLSAESSVLLSHLLGGRVGQCARKCLPIASRSGSFSVEASPRHRAAAPPAVRNGRNTRTRAHEIEQFRCIVAAVIVEPVTPHGWAISRAVFGCPRHASDSRRRFSSKHDTQRGW